MSRLPPEKIATVPTFSSLLSPPDSLAEALEEHRVGQEHFLSLFENSSEGVVLAGEDGIVMRANPGFSELFGYAPAEIAGAHIDALVAHCDPDIRDEAARINLILREKGHFSVESFRFGRDGVPIPVEMQGVAFSSAGRTFHFLIYRDLSIRREAERKLTRLVEMENLLLSISRKLVFSDDFDRDVRNALESLGEFFGADRSYLFLLEVESGEMHLAHEWSSDGTPRLSPFLTRVTRQERPWWFSQLEEGKPILIGDLDQLPDEAGLERAEFKAQGAGSFLTLPVYMGNTLGGALGLDNLCGCDRWREDHVKDLTLFADLLGRVFHQDRVNRILVRDVAQRLSLEEKAQLDEERLALALEASGDGFWELDLSSGTIEVSKSTLRFLRHESAVCTLSCSEWEGSIHPEDLGRITKALKTHLDGESDFYQERYRRKGVSGDYIWVLARGKVVKRDENGRPLRVAGLISDETERHHIEEVLEESLKRVNHLLEGTIDVISRLVESRDPYTAGHQERVSQLARAVAQRMGLSRERVRGIQVAGLLHDIGKVCVPSDILSKPGKLTSLEFDLIRDHPSRGGLILGRVDFPWPVREAVEQHHERLDGSGYPRGLVGKNIRLEARIMAVADVVEAMISHRPYRPALGLKAALVEIREGRGGIYDPEVVDACVQVFEEGFFFRQS